MTARQGSSAAAGAADDTAKTDDGPAPVAASTADDLAAMRAELDAMRAQMAARDVQDQAAAPEPAEPQESTHGVLLACGHTVELPNTLSTHHHCPEHGLTVPVQSVFALA